MTRTTYQKARQLFLRWLTKTILVIGLFTFSGHVAECRTFNPEPTKTELNEKRKFSSKKTVNFKNHSHSCTNYVVNPTDRNDKFALFLCYQKNGVAVKLKYNSELFHARERKVDFLIFHLSDNSDDSHINPIRG
jgi:hypothetical protein